MNQAFFIRAAVREHEEIVDFHVGSGPERGSGPVCSSFLSESSENMFWCAKSQNLVTTIDNIGVLIGQFDGYPK